MYIHNYVLADVHTYIYAYLHIYFICMHTYMHTYIVYCGAVWRIGRVDAFRPKTWVRLPLHPPRRDLSQVLHSQLPVALSLVIPAQYPCYVGSASA